MTNFRNGHGRILASAGDDRSPERIIAHYELERELADRLRNSAKTERSTVYGQVYSELFERLHDHPQHTAPRDASSARVMRELKIIEPYLTPSASFVEIGCGDAALSIAAASLAKSSIGIDVTGALVPAQLPQNFKFQITDGTSFNVESSSVDIVYSNQVMEHLHPDDAKDQLTEIRRILKKGGKYICITPNCVSGPHDVSKYFDEVATGFHIREYDYGSLKALFIAAGFDSFNAAIFAKGRQVPIPYMLVRGVERVIALSPRSFRIRVHTSRVARVMLGLNAIAVA